MKKLLCCGLLALLLLTGCAKNNANGRMPDFKGFVPSFSVVGDVGEVFAMNRDVAAGFAWTEVISEDVKLPVVLLSDVIAAAKPRASAYSLLLVGSDGLASMIDGKDLTGCFIAYSDAFAWECVNENHPISSKIKMLSEIVVISAEGAMDPASIGLVDAAGSRVTTAGRLRLSPYSFALEFEGRSELGGRDVTVFTPKRRVPLSSFVEGTGRACLMSRSGAILYERDLATGFLELSQTSLNHADMRDVVGLMTDAPMFNISEVYRDALHMLEKGERVLIIELDGWGWEMYGRAKQPYLGGLNATKALAVYPPISPVGLATMLTGELPDVHGIHDRENREIAGEDLFARAQAMGKSALYVEGETSLIKTSLPPILSPDLNGINGTDDEVYENAKQAAAEGPDLLFVHFHGIDDVATDLGPYAPETLAKITWIDGLVGDLAANWDGKVIITADHGLHEVEDGGSHGVFCAEDMLVPYAITTGGAQP